jgi:hypothetical protein
MGDMEFDPVFAFAQQQQLLQISSFLLSGGFVFLYIPFQQLHYQSPGSLSLSSTHLNDSLMTPDWRM